MAGKQLLSIENKWLADKVLVTPRLSNYFNFHGTRIITGKEKGTYGWITVNYLLGKFTKKLRWLDLTPNENNSQETHAALDLGGASMQITVVPPN